METSAYDDLIELYAEQYGVDPKIFRKLVGQESAFQKDAVSPKGAEGLGQVMPATARDPGYGVKPLSAEDIRDPKENLRFSAEYLRAMLDEFGGDYPTALAAYNAGPGSVQKYGGIPPFAETQNYVQTILGPVSGPPATGAPVASGTPVGLGEMTLTKSEPYYDMFGDSYQTREARNQADVTYNQEDLKAQKDIKRGDMLDALSDSLGYLNLANLPKGKQTGMQAPGIYRPRATGSGASALKRLGIGSLV